MRSPGPFHRLLSLRSDPREARLALAAAFAVVLAGAVSPFCTRFVGQNPSFTATMCTAALVSMATIAAIFLNQSRTTRRVPLAFLSIAYSIGAAYQLPIGLFAPRVVFAANEPGFAAIESWLWIVWHGLFVFALGGYVWAESFFSRQAIDHQHAMRILRSYALIAVSFAAILLLSCLAFADHFPKLVTGAGYTPLFGSVVETLLIAATAIVLIVHLQRGGLHNVIGIWISVVLFAIGVEMFVTGEIVRAPQSIGAYVASVLALFWQMLLLAVLLRHSSDEIQSFAAKEKELLEETLRDGLTDLVNRRGFDQRLSEALVETAAQGAAIALLALDLDDFKKYNDHFGHSSGDEALKSIAGVLASVASRQSDVACRTGGEEFCIVLPFTDQAGANVVAERVREKVLRLRMPHAPEATHPIMTVSIGVAASEPGTTITAHTLYERADQALYRSKRRGRNCITLYSRTAETSTLRVV